MKNNKLYSHHQKITSLRLLESNNFNFLRTSKETKIARRTLHTWEKLYGKEVFSGKNPTEAALVEIDAEMKYKETHIIRNLFIIRKSALHRVMILAEQETKIDTLINILKFVSGELQKFTEEDSNEKDKTINYIKIVTDQMIKNQEKKIELDEFS
jgi:hypothetical protein